MLVRLEEQTLVFIYAALLGVIMGGGYDIARIIRFLTGRKRKIKNMLIDVLFCLICAIVFMLFILTYASGELRYYIPLGTVLGMVLYFTGVSPFLLPIMLVPARLIRRGAKSAGGFIRKKGVKFKNWALND